MFLILHDGPLAGDGMDAWVGGFVDALARRGHDVHVLCTDIEGTRAAAVAAVWHHDDQGGVRNLLRHRPHLAGRATVHVVDRPAWPDATGSFCADALESAMAPVLRVARDVARGPTPSGILATDLTRMGGVAERLAERTRTPYHLLLSGDPGTVWSALGPDRMRYLESTLASCARIFVLDPQVEAELGARFPGLTGLRRRIRSTRLGVDAGSLRPVTGDARVEVLDPWLRRCVTQGCRVATPDTTAFLRSVTWPRAPLVACQAEDPVLPALREAWPRVLAHRPAAVCVVAGDPAMASVPESRWISVGVLDAPGLDRLRACSDLAFLPSPTHALELGPFLRTVASGALPLVRGLREGPLAALPVTDYLSSDLVARLDLPPTADAQASALARLLPTLLEESPRHRRALRRMAVTWMDWEVVASEVVQEWIALADGWQESSHLLSA